MSPKQEVTFLGRAILLATFFAASLLIFAPAAIAEPPSGNIISPMFSGPTEGLYDLTGIISTIDENFSGNGGGSNPDTNNIRQDISLTQAPTGVLSGGGDTTVTLSTPSDLSGHPNTFMFPATYTVHGRVRSSGPDIAVTLGFMARASGVELGDGVQRNVREAINYAMVIDRAAGTLSGRKSGHASASGRGSIKLMSSTIAEQPAPAPVNWYLSLNDLTTTGSKVTGTATAVLANSRTFPFMVRGTYSPMRGSMLRLTGTGVGKGARLNVAVSDTTITHITGILLGQKLDL